MNFGGEGGQHLVHAGGELLKHRLIHGDAVALHGGKDGQQGAIELDVELRQSGLFRQ